ncbi:MAG TPA: FkbM family methyltransferase [Aliidongia sp.]|uniref:FkbM family methyltransferase n=1 Tax=Aliidongia sp. TaxID=1914230 RepID=UPI002DDD5405|nr:FkbM family methyltransferase [Aliidongia sp.]HEV2678195.1 FkbM family methyltransferase [Aliidongia sp.]
MTSACTVDELKAEVDRLLDRYERAEIKDGRLLEPPETRDIALEGRPVALLGAGAAFPQEFVRHLVERHHVVALVDNVRIGEARYEREFVGDAAFLDVAHRAPDLVAVMCCASDGAVAHFAALAARAGVPVLSLFQAMRREGLLSHGRAHGVVETIETLAHANPHLDRFADELSLRTYYCLLLHRLSWSRHWLDMVRFHYDEMYFGSGIFPLSHSEILVDGGAFDGDSIRAFDRFTGGEATHIHAFEPDGQSAAALRHNFAGRSNLTLVEAGLWSETTRLSFRSDGSLGSNLSTAGTITVPVVALDDRGIDDATLIKLDIEGAEVPALNGARDTIRRCAPKLAVCAYHLADDLLQIPRTILAIRPEYRLFLRHYSPWMTDTVVYAV